MPQLDVYTVVERPLSSPLDSHIHHTVESPIKLSKHRPSQQRGGEVRASRDADAHNRQGWLADSWLSTPRTTENASLVIHPLINRSCA